MTTSIARGRASNSATATVDDADWSDILPENFIGCEEILIECDEESTAPLLIAVTHRAVGDTAHRSIGADGSHAEVPDDYFPLAAGQSIAFPGTTGNKIVRAMAAGSGGTASFRWTVTKP